MERELRDLFKYLKEEKNEELVKKFALLFARYSFNSSIIKVAQENLPKTIQVDLNELESLVNPDRFDFPEPEIGIIGVKEDEESI